MKAGIRVAAMLIALFLVGCASRPQLATVPSVDLKRYEGRWFEIAKYPNWFQRSCASDTTANYTALPDGTIQVLNRCKQADGTFRDAKAIATVTPGSGNAKLKVRFGRSPIGGDYWIIGLDEKNYSWHSLATRGANSSGSSPESHKSTTPPTIASSPLPNPKATPAAASSEPAKPSSHEPQSPPCP